MSQLIQFLEQSRILLERKKNIQDKTLDLIRIGLIQNNESSEKNKQIDPFTFKSLNLQNQNQNQEKSQIEIIKNNQNAQIDNHLNTFNDINNEQIYESSISESDDISINSMNKPNESDLEDETQEYINQSSKIQSYGNRMNNKISIQTQNQTQSQTQNKTQSQIQNQYKSSPKHSSNYSSIHNSINSEDFVNDAYPHSPSEFSNKRPNTSHSERRAKRYESKTNIDLFQTEKNVSALLQHAEMSTDRNPLLSDRKFDEIILLSPKSSSKERKNDYIEILKKNIKNEKKKEQIVQKETIQNTNSNQTKHQKINQLNNKGKTLSDQQENSNPKQSVSVSKFKPKDITILLDSIEIES